jgi:hypothetical protein
MLAGPQQCSRQEAGMEDTVAAQILRRLAAGELQLVSGAETLVASGTDASDPVVDLKRALFVAVDALEQRTRVAARRQGAMPRNAGKPWTAAEDGELLQRFDSGLAVEALAAAHERTRAGIEARLVRHGRLDERIVRGGQGLRYAPKERAPPG